MMWWTDYTASLIAPITVILRREEFHDDGDSSSCIFVQYNLPRKLFMFIPWPKQLRFGRNFRLFNKYAGWVRGPNLCFSTPIAAYN